LSGNSFQSIQLSIFYKGGLINFCIEFPLKVSKIDIYLLYYCVVSALRTAPNIMRRLYFLYHRSIIDTLDNGTIRLWVQSGAQLRPEHPVHILYKPN
jgi:hypothetical protein